jgi:hypothetical protein
MKFTRFGLAALALALASCAGENHYEQLADQVTRAIVANDMRPVEKDFNALARPQLENRARVGELSDELGALGAFKRTHEQTVAGETAGVHTLNAEFAKATWRIQMRIDSDGKIAAFRIAPPPDSKP